MNIGILVAGNMTNTAGPYLIRQGHKLLVSYSRDRGKLEQVSQGLGGGTRAGSPEEAARFAMSSCSARCGTGPPQPCEPPPRSTARLCGAS